MEWGVREWPIERRAVLAVCQPIDGVDIKFEEGDAHSETVLCAWTLDGSSNVNFQNISQWVVVQPNTHYRFSAYIR